VLTIQPSCTTTYTTTSNAGSIQSTNCSGAGSSNYSFTYVGGTVTVNQAPVTVTASSAVVAYGDPVPAVTASFSGFRNGQTSAVLTIQPSCTTTYTTTSNAGSIQSTNCSGAGSSNYSFTYVGGTVTVNQAPVTVTASSAVVAYGDPVPAVTASFSGFRDGQTSAVLTIQPACTTAYTPTSNAGSAQTTSCSGAVAANYRFTYVGGTVTIGKAPLTVTTLPSAKLYGDPLPAFMVQYSGFVLGDGPGALGGTLVFVTPATPTSPVSGSPYAVAPAGLTAANYAISFVPGSLTVNKTTPVFSNLTSMTLIGGASSTMLGGSIAYTPAGGGSPVFPSGNVQVTLNGVTQPAAISAAGTFSSAFVTASLAPGSYPVTYSYTSGDGNFNPAADGAGTLKVAGFVTTGSMGTERSYHTATLLASGKVLVAGGFNKNGQPLASGEIYDPLAGTFSPTANAMPNKAAGHTATLLPGGQVLIVGGGNSSAQLFDPSTNLWGAAGGSGQRSYHTAVLLPGGKVLIAGGSDNSGKTLNSAQIYDPVAGSFTSTGNLTVSRDFHTATLLANGKVLITGGRTSSGSGYAYLASAELYDPAAGTFTAVLTPMSSARFGHTAAVINGKVLISGGSKGTAAVAGSDLYDPTAGSFSATGALAAARQFFTATTAGSGVLVTGGLSGATTLQSAESYQVGAFLAAGNMTTARAAHTATLLNDGRILVIGGHSSSGVSIATAELYINP
jgi:hypothetical protein